MSGLIIMTMYAYVVMYLDESLEQGNGIHMGVEFQLEFDIKVEMTSWS